MVVEVLVARRQGQHPLRHQRLQAMLDPPRVAVVPEARRQPRRHPEAPVNLPQQQHAAIGRQPAAVEPAHHRTPAKAFKRQLRRGTVCVHGVAPLWTIRCCLSYLYHTFLPHAPTHGEISGLAMWATNASGFGCGSSSGRTCPSLNPRFSSTDVQPFSNPSRDLNAYSRSGNTAISANALPSPATSECASSCWTSVGALAFPKNQFKAPEAVHDDGCGRIREAAA